MNNARADRKTTTKTATMPGRFGGPNAIGGSPSSLEYGSVLLRRRPRGSSWPSGPNESGILGSDGRHTACGRVGGSIVTLGRRPQSDPYQSGKRSRASRFIRRSAASTGNGPGQGSPGSLRRPVGSARGPARPKGRSARFA